MLALPALAWTLAAFLQTGDIAQAGYSLSRGQQVVRVVAGSPADQAGIRKGDSIITIDGFATGNRSAVARLSRGRIGETRRLEVQRGAETLKLDLVLAGLTPLERWRRLAAIFTGLCFILITGLAFLRFPGPASRALAVMGLGFGVAFMRVPALQPEALQLAVSLARSAMILAGVGASLHFLRLMVTAPGPARWHPSLIYAPLAAFWLLHSVRTVFAASTPALVNRFANLSGGLLFFIYLAMAITTLVRAWVRSRQAGDPGGSLSLLCLGTLLGLLPVGIAALLPVLAPDTALPGTDFWFLSLVVMPLSWARAAVTGNGAES